MSNQSDSDDSRRQRRPVEVRGATPPRPCPVGVVAGSSPCPVNEFTCLLQRRLRIAAPLFVGVSVFFLIRNIITAVDLNIPSIDLILHAIIVAVTVPLSVLLWVHGGLRLRTLRMIEVAVFGMPALFFAFGQLEIFHCMAPFRQAAVGQEGMVMRLTGFAASIRWFMLIVVYGTFIPNGWKRSAVIAGVMALTPLMITAWIGIADGNLGSMIGALLDMAMVLLVAVAVAVFGAHKIEALRMEAFNARQLGQYRLKKLLGSGGMGEVYLAEHLLLRRPCAIKLIRPDQAGDPASLSRFEREVRATATLTHWNTVEIFDFGRTADGTFYYVMEYLPGISLEDMVERHGPLAPERVVHFLRQMCAGLREAHGIGLVHRDIKPSNVIACERGGVYDVAKVVDFGLVQDSGLKSQDVKLTLQGTILGSPPYMSPEQALGKEALDPRTDIYSLGAVAYYLLTGRPPFVRETALELLIAHSREAVTPLRELRPDVPHDLESVVLRCLEKKPADRFTDIASIDQALAACDSAGQWTEDRAADWWRNREAAEETQLMPASTVNQETEAYPVHTPAAAL